MRTIKAIIVGVACLTAGAANAQWVVHDPGNLAQGIINTAKEIVETSATAQHTLDGFRETAKIFEQGRKYYNALKAVHDVVKGGVKVKKSIGLVADISEIYVRNYQKMLGDPNYTPDEPETSIGKYGRMRKSYLKEHRPILYNQLLMSEKLYPHLIEIDRTAQERVDTMLPHMMEAAGVTEELKACDPMRWVGLMNTLKAQAEEIILDELIL